MGKDTGGSRPPAAVPSRWFATFNPRRLRTRLASAIGGSALTAIPPAQENDLTADNERRDGEPAERAQAEAALRASEERFRLLVEGVTDYAIFMLDPDGHVASWNAGAERIKGYRAEEIIGQHFSRFYPLEELAAGKPAYELRVAAAEGRYEEEGWRVRQDGSRFWANVVLTALYDEAGQLRGFVKVTRDITERRQAEEELQRLTSQLERRVRERTAQLEAANQKLAGEIAERQAAEAALQERERTLQAIIGASPDIIMMVGPDGRIGSVSPVIREILGYVPENIQGTDGLALVHADDLEQMSRELQKIFTTGEATAARQRVRHDDGHWVMLESHARPMTDTAGNATGAVVVSRDVTAQVELEAALRQAKEMAEEASRSKSEFLSRMSHELRTPLNAILGFGQLLEMGDLTPDDRESVTQILKAGRHLLALINEVLDIARIEAGRLSLSLEPVPLGEIIQESLDLVTPLAAQRQIAVRLDGRTNAGRHVMADRQRLKQVLLNLLMNAVKYNRSQGEVVLGADEIAGDRLRIAVRDTGPGIPADKLGRLFTPFERLGAEQTETEGTGLGLALSQRLVELMGGTIGVNSAVGQGSTFWVELPLVDSPVAQAARTPTGPLRPLPGASRSTTILYIEDNLSNLRLIERLLEGQPGIRLISAVQGRLGLELAQEHRPHLILLDLHLPDISGEEVLHQLQAQPATRAIPVVVLSADATPNQIERLLAAGAQAYLTKPLDVKQFLKLVEATLTQRT